MKCSKCHREATMDAPDDLCDLHWVLWSTEGYETIRPDLDIIKIRIQDLEDIWAKYYRPDDADSQLEELKNIGSGC